MFWTKTEPVILILHLGGHLRDMLLPLSNIRLFTNKQANIIIFFFQFLGHLSTCWLDIKAYHEPYFHYEMHDNCQRQVEGGGSSLMSKR